MEVSAPDCQHFSYNSFDNTASTMYSSQKKIKLPYLAEGDYYGLVKVRSNLIEVNLNNNENVTDFKIGVGAASINLNDPPTTISFMPSYTRVFKIDSVPAEETLVISLKSTSSTLIYHTLLVKYLNPPSFSLFDYVSDLSEATPTSTKLVVKTTKAGTYYVLVESLSSQDTNSYQIYLQARVAKFEISTVSPMRILKGFNTTIKITGTKFERDTQVFVNDINSNRIYPLVTHHVSSELIYACFLITDWQTSSDSLILELINSNNAATNHNLPLKIIENLVPGSLKITSAVSGSISNRVNNPILYSFYVQNNGNSDVRTPILFVTLSEKNVKLRLINDISHQSYFIDYMFVALPNQASLTDVLLAGSVTQFDFEIVPPNMFAGSTKIDVNQVINELDWTASIGNFKPYNVNTLIWSFLENSFTKFFNSTDSLIETAKCFAYKQKNVYSVMDLLYYQINFADNFILGKRMHESIDLNFLDNSNFDTVHLTKFIRQYSPRITSRRQIGIFGYGWSNMILDSHLSIQKNNSVLIFVQNNEEYQLPFQSTLPSSSTDNRFMVNIDSKKIDLFDRQLSLNFRFDRVEFSL